MMQYLSGCDLFAELLMVRSTFQGTLFLLEGDADCRLFDRFVDPQGCRTIPGNGRQNVLEALCMVGGATLSGIVGLVDADFARVEGSIPDDPNVVLTEFHDVEIMLVLSQAIERVLTEYASGSKLRKFVQARGRPHLRDVLLEVALPLGLTRLISSRGKYGLRFKDLDFTGFIDLATLHVDEDKMLKVLLQRSAGAAVNKSVLRAELQKAGGMKHDIRQVCSGHDVVQVLGIALRRAVGACKKVVAQPRNVEKMLRLAFGMKDFVRTGVYRDLRVWESSHAPYRILGVGM